MKNIFVSALLLTAFSSSFAYAEPKPIFLNRVEQERNDICKRKVTVLFGGMKYSLPRTQGLTYVGVDGKKIDIGNPDHPYNNCKITDAGEATRFATGMLPSSLDLQVELIPADKKAEFKSTYAEYKTQIEENMAQDEYKNLPGQTSLLQWGTSIMYLLPQMPNETANGERVAIYCKLPAGFKEGPTVTREDRRKACSTRYLFADGVAFGYSYREGLKEYKPFELDIAARRELAGLVLKEKKRPDPTP